MTEYLSQNEARCDGCGRTIVWIRTKKGRPIPINPDTIGPNEFKFDPKGKGHVAHFTTCPKAADFRRTRSRSQKAAPPPAPRREPPPDPPLPIEPDAAARARQDALDEKAYAQAQADLFAMGFGSPPTDDEATAT